MSELNETLQISPEDFLRLQPLCKQFMLDPEHPERFNMVGRKESPQVDVNKVRLFEVTTKFLVEGGWGEEFWGEKNEIANRTYKWPESKEDIAHSMVGLMRRMVTNEKQRLYATAQREKRERGYKAASSKSKKPKIVDARSLLNKLKGIESSSEEQSMSPSPDAESFTQGSPPPSSRTLKPDEDLGQISRGQESIATSTLPSNTSIASASLKRATSVVSVQSTSPRFPDCWLNILQSGRRILPKVPFNTDNGEKFHDLLQFIDIIIDDGHSYKEVKVSGPTGVIDVNDEASWSAALEAIKDADWMDGEVRVMVDIAT
ncbi:hypothetical protein B0O99DRAFT_145545 [Bisporella sp. PMI_857]|nr:hypothetical protein B0O99DRAFT_145545 [Bisporella sp. PMI_857]